ncbi:hypothetical protein PRBRB14_27290 [Hallella multisaccharivorax DSM 17128]|uniref:Tetratricopeptide repeat protein n=1 Tax=Hallella multisaccharivorax DSM 17128 TaxID=688246 RepID=F8N587_9BACT|nr:hypothetical protein [Hallella multisaccharivorax]EGN58252.1 hypothetical protein Premu_0048 [Hallella multisaccharivorax DSM 17128]GJG31850.1 hypothetical protein PRBRB14_27290 [Hallella multisaccharivorax DSM 17128]
MKRLGFILLFMLSLGATDSFAASNNNRTAKVTEIVNRLNTVATADANEEAIYELDRLDKIYQNDWLIKYYISYCKFRRGLLDPDNAKNYFGQALTYMRSLDTNLVKAHPDLMALQARIMIMELAIDSSKGEQYVPYIAYLLQTSLAKEPKNSRVNFVEGMFCYFMPSFCGGDKAKGKEFFAKAYGYYKDEPKDELPRWRKELYESMINVK